MQANDWQELIAHRPEVRLVGFGVFQSHLVLLEREKGLERFILRDFGSGQSAEIPMDEPIFTINFSSNPNFDTPRFRYVYSSMTTPTQTWEYEFESGERHLLKQTPVPSYDPSLYKTERIWASADDGKLVPVSLVYKDGVVLNGQNPALLYGYGSYAVSYTHLTLPTICSV